MSDGLTIRAPAKVNLRLRVLAREVSGYHQLETVFCALELADTLEVRAAEEGGIELEVAGADVGPVEDNLVVRAARAFGEAVGREPDVWFRLTKRIPAGAGLGGGSSDAAAALEALNTLHGEPLDRDELLELAAGLGADIPFFLCGSPHALAWGHGERLLALDPLPARPVLIVLPPFSISTAEAYAGLDSGEGTGAEGPAPGHRAAVWDPGSLATWDEAARVAANDFELTTFAAHPPLGAVKNALGTAGASLALLAGSGSAVFGVFDRDADVAAAARAVASRWPEMELMETGTATG